MNAGAAVHARHGDIVSTIASAMREMGVTGLPRNYEIFYEVFAGSNDELRHAFLDLGRDVTQAQLDDLGQRYLAGSNGMGIVENARAQIEAKLDEIRDLLRRERNSLEKYGHILDRTSDGLAKQPLPGAEFLQKVLAITTAATETTREHGRQIVTSINHTSNELETVRTKLEEYKKLADTDPLTSIGNRRAFDSAISTLYDDPQRVMFGALLLADIDRFKDINDRHGHPIGDRIIQLIAGVLRRAVPVELMVARTGGEEFAVVVDGLSEDSVHHLAEQIRQAVEGTNFANRDTGTSYGRITISLGLCMASEASSPADLYSKADSALYASKMGGRNRTTLHSALGTKPGKNWMIYKTE